MDSQTTPNTARRSRRSKIVGTVIALAVMAALGGGAWYLTHSGASAQGGAGGPGGPGGPGGRRGGPSTTVGVATAVKSDLPVVLDALGTVTAASTVTVRPQVSGILKELKFKEGGMVKAGQVVAQIDPAQFEMALMQATGQRQRDEAQLENARLTLKRYQTLLGQDSIARQDVDTQAALVKQLEGTVMTDRAAEGTARLDLGSLSALDNQVDVQTGTVRAKARYANDKMALFPSQFVNVRLELGNITGAVLVPVTALRHSNNGDFVYVLKADKTVSVRPVTRGQATIDMVE